MKSEYYYENNERLRIEHLKRRYPELYKVLLDKEESYRSDLIIMLLKYKNKDKYLKDMLPMVSLRYIDTLREFIELNETKIQCLKHEGKVKFQNISKKFIKFIPVKAKREYETRGLVSTKSHQKYLPFLKLNELLK